MPIGAPGAVDVRARAQDPERDRIASAACDGSWPLGPLVVIATGRRLLVWRERTWGSVWYTALTRIRSDLPTQQIDLFSRTDAPYRLRAGVDGSAQGSVDG